MNEERSKKYGQYPTPVDIADFMIGLSTSNKNAPVLDPGCGEGIFVNRLSKFGYSVVIGYEIDPNLKHNGEAKIFYRSFVSENFKQKFDLIIGNPPYVRWKYLEPRLKAELDNNDLWKRYCNSLCDYSVIFIIKAIELLNDQGELIFITPEYWINTQHSQALRDYMTHNGFFESIYHFNETPIFPKVTSSILIFKYIKSKLRQINRNRISVCKYYSKERLDKDALDLLRKRKLFNGVEYFEIDQFKTGENWNLVPDNIKQRLEIFEQKCAVRSLFPDTYRKYHQLGDIADIGNGLVSGLDKAFQLPKGANLNESERRATIKVLKAKDMLQYVHGGTTDYIFIDKQITETELMEKYPNFYNHLLKYRATLDNRYHYNRDIKYWEWVFLRNYQLFSKNQERIFIPCKERISHKNYFRFSYVESKIYPTQDVTAIFLKNGTRESIHYILALLNSHQTFEWLKHKGTIKGNIVEFCDRPLSVIPLRLIDWNNEEEVDLHNRITSLCQDYIQMKDQRIIEDLKKAVGQLL